jgi:cytoskeletal protein RodZ
MAKPGLELKKIRLEKGISLEEVQKKTKIHLNILKAIEGDSLTHLSPVYLKGFLKIYCNFLGVDPKEYVSVQKEAKAKEQKIIREGLKKEENRMQAKGQTARALEKFQALKKPVTLFIINAAGKLKGLKAHSQTFKQVGILVFAFLFLAFIFFNFGKFISNRRKAYQERKKSTSSQTSRTKVREAAEKYTAQKASKTVAGPKSSSSRVTNSDIRLGVRTKENCWISVKVDGKVVFQRTLEKGRFESWQAKNKIELSVGNATSVELEVNGQLFSNLGRRGQALKNILITKEGLQIER